MPIPAGNTCPNGTVWSEAYNGCVPRGTPEPPPGSTNNCPGEAPACPGGTPRCWQGDWSCVSSPLPPVTPGTPPACPSGRVVYIGGRLFCETDPVANPVPGTSTNPPNNGDCPPGTHRGGGHPGNPCRADQPGTPSGGTGPSTVTEQLRRFYTNDWENYLWTGETEQGVPQPQGSLLSTLQNQLFQSLVGQWGIDRVQDQQEQFQDRRTGPGTRPQGSRMRTPMFSTEPRDVGVLGLQGGAAAYGYVDPSWRFDTRTTTTGGSGGATPPATPPGGGSNPCGGDTMGCPPGHHRGGCHPGNPCRPDGGGPPVGEAAPAPTPTQPPNSGTGNPPGPTPGPIAQGGGGNPCGGTQGCPPGQHRAGCHPGNECKPDQPMLGLRGPSQTTPLTSLLGAFSGKTSSGPQMFGLT